MNQLRAKQQSLTHKTETLQEKSYKVVVELVATQGLVKNIVQESVEKVNTHIIAEMVAKIV